MKESEFARNQRLQREAVERVDARSEVALELTQQAALIAAQSRDLQARQLAAQEESLESQRQHQWAMWTQTDDGRAFLAWERSAQRLIDQSERRDRDLMDAHRSDVAELVTDDERAKHKSGVWLTKNVRERRAERLGLASGTVFALTATYIVVNFGLSLFDRSVPYEWRTVLALVGVAVVLMMVGAAVSDPERSKQNKLAGHAASRRRTQVFGFDPLLEPERLPAAWADAESDSSDYWVHFSQLAREVYPAASALPVLRAPAVRAPGDGDSPRVRILLLEWASAAPAPGGATA